MVFYLFSGIFFYYILAMVKRIKKIFISKLILNPDF